MRTLLLSLLLLTAIITGFTQTRKNYRLPDIPGYITLKGDFHMHTPFSDGSVWPSDRVMEAWRDGLDVIAITDHLEYSPNKPDVSADLNRPYEIAKPVAEKYGILLIRGAEITRSMPPGHFNAYFTTDNNALKKKDFRDVFKVAEEQGAFFNWNHPGWKAQQADTIKWFTEHTEIFNNGWMDGIEIFNEKEYYPIVHSWANEKNLSIFANSDVHSPIDFLYAEEKGESRPMTLVFAKEKSLDGVREAFFAHSTVALFNDTLAGPKEFLVPFVRQCIRIHNPVSTIVNNNQVSLILTNVSDFPFVLSGISDESTKLPDKIILMGNSSEAVEIKNLKDMKAGINTLYLSFRVLNVLPAPGTPLVFPIDLEAFYWKTPIVKSKGMNEWMIDPGDNSSVWYVYTTDGSEPMKSSNNVYMPFKATSDSIQLRIKAYRCDTQLSKEFNETFILHKALNSKISTSVPPAEKYYCNGTRTLTDGICGSDEYNDGKWLGFREKDLELTIELETPTDISAIETHFIEKTGSWIFLPSTVGFFVSEDGVSYSELGQVTYAEPKDDSSKGIVTCEMKKSAEKVKYIRILAKNQGLCPAWHSAAGKPAWLFVDEVIVK